MDRKVSPVYISPVYIWGFLACFVLLCVLERAATKAAPEEFDRAQWSEANEAFEAMVDQEQWRKENCPQNCQE